MKRLLVIVAAALTCAAAAGPAQGAVSVSSFTVTPSSTAAGANPDLSVDVTFASTDADSVKDATVSLASGLLADPTAAAICSSSEFAADACPSSSQIGDGSINGTATAINTAVTLPIGIYLIQPQGSEVARIGVIADLFDFPVVSASAPVQLRTAPDVGIDIPITGIPDEISDTSVEINELSLRLFGTVDGKPFTRNPTSCDAADTTLSVDSYGEPSTPVTADSSFTPTGCASLAYAPQLTADATVDQGDSGVAFAASITQSAADATTSSVTLALPSGLQPRLATLLSPCTAPDPSSCPPIGSATVTTPLLSSPAQGQLVIVPGSGGLPAIDAVFGAPLSLTLKGVPSLTADGVSATFSGIPDVPITELDVDFAGGATSAFTAGAGFCSTPQTVDANFKAENGASAHLSPTIKVTGSCSSSPPSSPPPGGGKAGRPTARLAFAKLTGRKPRLKLTVTAGKAAPMLALLGLKLPRGFSIVKRRFPRGLSATLDGHALARKAASLKGGLRLSLAHPGRVATITISVPSVKLSRTLIKKLRHHHKVKLTLVVTVKDAAGTTTTLRPSATVR